MKTLTMKARRLVSLLLVMAISVTCLLVTAPSASATAGNDYTQWKQYDTAWNQSEAWPKEEYPNATMRMMKQAGCAVTSIAMLLRQYEVVTDSNVNNFNPWICNEELKAAGAFNSAADILWDNVKYAYPNFVYQGIEDYSASRLYDLYSQDYACLVRVNYKGGTHFVAIRSATSSSATIMDPGSSSTSLSRYGTTDAKIYYFEPTASTSSSNTTSLPTISSYNLPQNIKEGKTFSIYGQIKSATPITSVTAGLYHLNGYRASGKTVYPNTTSYSLRGVDSALLFNKLAAGTYIYKVTATNAAGTQTLINSYFTIYDVSVSCSLKPACATGTRLDVKNSSKSNGANIWIYNSNGTSAQKFVLYHVGGGYYVIMTSFGKALDVTSGNAVSGQNVQQYELNGTFSQQWRLIDAGNGYYMFASRLNENLCLDVSNSGGSTSNVQIWYRNNSNAQRWSLV